jgi:hypothetical protein
LVLNMSAYMSSMEPMALSKSVSMPSSNFTISLGSLGASGYGV